MRFASLFLAAFFLQQTAPIPTPPSLRARFVEDMRSKNIDDVLALYAPDAVFVQPDGSTVDAAGLHALYEKVFATFDSDLTLDRPHHHEIGEPHNFTAIVEEGAYTENLRTRATGVTQHLCGAYTFTYSKNPAGGWLISRMAWTSTPCSTSAS